MAWVTRWELDRFLSLDSLYRAAVKRNHELETLIANKELEAKPITVPNPLSVDLMARMGGHLPSQDASRPPKGLERLVPGVKKYVTSGYFDGRRWDMAAIKRDIKRLEVFDDYQAGKALHKQLEKEAEEWLAK